MKFRQVAQKFVDVNKCMPTSHFSVIDALV